MLVRGFASPAVEFDADVLEASTTPRSASSPEAPVGATCLAAPTTWRSTAIDSMAGPAMTARRCSSSCQPPPERQRKKMARSCHVPGGLLCHGYCVMIIAEGTSPVGTEPARSISAARDRYLAGNGTASTTRAPRFPMARVSLGAAAESLATRDPVIASLLAETGPPHLPRPRAPHFEALVRAIVYQQLAGAAAGAIYGRLVRALGGDVEPDRLQALSEARKHRYATSPARSSTARSHSRDASSRIRATMKSKRG
jgi:hypothetical protein